MDDLSDLDLVEAAKAGDTTSFGELVRRHGPRLLALARQVVGPDAAEDVIQEAMVDSYRGLAGFAGHAAVGTWLYRIALNRCLQERRRRKPMVVDTEPLELLARWEDPDYSVDPALVAARRSHAETLQSVLAQLPEGYRNACCSTTGKGSRRPSWPRRPAYPWARPSRISAAPAWPCSRCWPRTTAACWRKHDDRTLLPPGPIHGLGLHRRGPPSRPGPLPRRASADLLLLPAPVRLAGGYFGRAEGARRRRGRGRELVRRVLAALAEPPWPDDPLPRQA